MFNQTSGREAKMARNNTGSAEPTRLTEARISLAGAADQDTPHIDLGKYYVGRTIDAMEEWHSKPREGYHVSDVVMCPRQRVYREIDRRPLGAKNVSIYSSGRAIHEAYQLLFRSDKRNRKICRVRRH